jgi:GNAT superfamily N-acetyltransferase
VRAEADIRVRRVVAADERSWRALWAGYCAFYEVEMPEEVTRATWSRVLGPGTRMSAIVADLNGRIVGMANYVLHDTTWSADPVCYLQDLFVDPEVRARGVGRTLIDWLLAQMEVEGWSRVYWSTRENNYRARQLYDKYTQHSGFLRYVVAKGARRGT